MVHTYWYSHTFTSAMFWKMIMNQFQGKKRERSPSKIDKSDKLRSERIYCLWCEPIITTDKKRFSKSIRKRKRTAKKDVRKWRHVILKVTRPKFFSVNDNVWRHILHCLILIIMLNTFFISVLFCLTRSIVYALFKHMTTLMRVYKV